MMFCTGHVLGLCQGVWGGSAGSGRSGPGTATGIETVIHFPIPGQYLPRQSFTFLSFYWKLIDLMVSITCLCFFDPPDTLSLNKNFPNFHFH